MRDFKKQEILGLLRLITRFDRKKNPKILKDVIIGTVFLEASTRTLLSFTSAAKRLGAKTLRFPSVSSSFQQKNESFSDTLRVIQHYADLLVLRHPQEGAARLASELVNVPIINAGDGSNQHPTQTFVDLYTIKKCVPSFDSLSIAFVGDLRFGRTIHSLIEALSHFNTTLYLISPNNLRLPDQYLRMLQEKNIVYHECEHIKDATKHCDILYMTRFQRERFVDDEEFDFIESNYSIDLSFLTKHAHKKLKVLHPLPRGKEINNDVDTSPYCTYFEQAQNGLPVRQALLAYALQKTGAPTP